MVNQEPDCCEPLGELKREPDKTILFKLPNDNHPEVNKKGQMKDSPYQSVIMPWDNAGNISWSQIVNLLNAALKGNGLKSFDQLSKLMKSVNPEINKEKLNVLEQVIETMNLNEKRKFFDETFPFIISSALELSTLVDQCIPLLQQRFNHTLFFNQQQLTSILANGFLGTFPNLKSPKLNHFSFQKLFSATSKFNRKAEKIKCILNYFHRVLVNPPKGIVSFQRRCISSDKIPNWSKSAISLKQMIVKSQGTIEEDGKGMIQLDFAHKLIGGKTLDYGMVQEEIRFVINPELIVSMLFTETMLDNEAIIITGTEKFNKYSGYADTFKFQGDYFDETPLDSWGRRYTKVVAIDACYFAVTRVRTQYTKKFIDRELIKSYAGFNEEDTIKEQNRCAVATGNWGCGVYRGDPQLKSLIQLISASMNYRDIVYFTFGNAKLADLVVTISHLDRAGLTTGQLYNYLIEYGNYANSQPFGKNLKSLFAFLEEKLNH